jgi:hypothetical protein
MADSSSHKESDYLGGPRLPAWEVDTLPDPPTMRWSPLALIGPGLMMAGAAIGGGEWLTGPRNTALYGGTLMWLAGFSIFFQVIYNLEVIRYAMYSGESIFVGFFRLMPGPKFWTVVYLCIDFFGLWPYLSASAAVPLAAAFLGHVPGVVPFAVNFEMKEEQFSAFADEYKISEDDILVARVQVMRDRIKRLSDRGKRTADPRQQAVTDQQLPLLQAEERVLLNELESRTGQSFSSADAKLPATPTLDRWKAKEDWLVKLLSLGVFLSAFIPLIFGGKIYKVLEAIMTVKIVLVLAYLLLIGFLFISPSAWAEAFGGFVFLSRDYYGMLDGVPQFSEWSFRLFPPGELDWALLGAFAAVAGQGGLNNAQFSSYARDKGWGMGQKVGAIPSLVGGRDLKLPHTGTKFEANVKAMPGWLTWMRLVRRDQWLIWFTGCVLGMAIPSLVSLDVQFRETIAAVGDNGAPAATSFALSKIHPAFWYMTLICGFLVLAPNQISTTDGLARRWTEVIWTASPRLHHLPGSSVRYLYFGLLIAYGIWGVLVLLWLGDKATAILKLGSVIMNFALGFSALHTLVVNTVLLPKPVRPSYLSRLGLVGCGVFFIAVACLGAPKAIRDAKVPETIQWIQQSLSSSPADVK